MKKSCFYEKILGHPLIPFLQRMNTQKPKSKKKIIILATLGVLGGIALCFMTDLFGMRTELLSGGILPRRWDEPWQDPANEGIVIKPPDGNAVDMIKTLIWKNAVPMFKYLMIGVSILMYIIYLMEMITSSGSEEKVKKSQLNMLWAILGFLVLALAEDLSKAFDPWISKDNPYVDEDKIESGTMRLISYFQLLASIVAIFYIFWAGFRMITAHGDEDTINAQKNHIKWGFVGLVFIVLSEVAVKKIFYPYAYGEKRGLGQEEATEFIRQGTGTLNFFLGFVGILAVVSLVASGYMYVASGGDEEAAGKAKKNLIGSILAIVIIVSAFVIVRAFVPS